MNIKEVLAAYDKIEESHDISKILGFLDKQIDRAKKEGDTSSLITLYNEQIGATREFGHYDSMIDASRQLLALLSTLQLEGTLSFATSLLNIASGCRAAGLLKEAMVYYNETKNIYDRLLDPEDYAYAALYNNMALLFEELEDYTSATLCLSKALALARKKEDEPIKLAISLTNLAMCLLKSEDASQARDALSEAFSIFDALPEKDYHYGAALSAMAEACYKDREYALAVDYYDKALAEVNRNMGKDSGAYKVTLSNLKMAADKYLSTMPRDEQMNGNTLCKAYFEEIGLPEIDKNYKDYKTSMVIGLAGEGSECEGFDDENSLDHDFGPGFCIWLEDDVYDRIGEELQSLYDSLPLLFRGYLRLPTKEAGKRVGVFRVSDWFSRYLGKPCPETANDWLFIDDEAFRKVTNGSLFYVGSPSHTFCRLQRRIKEYYPEWIRLKKLSRELSLACQYGQYNYNRMLYRGDVGAARICLGSFTEHAAKCIYLLYKTYAPFYKWLCRGLRDIDEVAYSLFEGSCNEPEDYIRAICEHILSLLKKQGLLADGNKSDYLDHHTAYLSGIADRLREKEQERMEKEERIKKIIDLEWKAFDQAQNEGGRASCQNNFPTFHIMRKSQYLLWDVEMLDSIIQDFEEANARGWNMIAEKYGRMEKSTAPEEWAKIKDAFPPISEEKSAIIEGIVALQVSMMEEFSKDYPKVAGNARSIHTADDGYNNTSYETYLRGELSTYSDNTLYLYGRFIAGLASQGRNLARETIENTAKLYGFADINEMEQKA